MVLEPGSNRSVPTDGVLPHIAYIDVDAAATWLAVTLGFIEVYRYGQPVSGILVRRGPAVIMLERNRSVPDEVDRQRSYLTIIVPDVDACHERAVAAGARVTEPLNETVYGERQFVVVDPEGQHWLIGQHVRDLDPAAWGATVAPSVG